ncbi:MAG TPA: alpha/beta fold hydrolase [Acidimicrobiales bacterium]|nr:alpha/beta fold hydrolase [Acidimicrobiales bacterium]
MAFAWAADGTRLHYRLLGRSGRDPVLMIQGLGTDMSGWTLQRLRFSPHLPTVAIDNRGAGRSDKPFGRYSLEAMADDAITVLDDAGIDRVHVMGASMGGAISQLIALRHPDRVRSLVLACTACRNHQWRRELLNEWASIANERGMGEMAKRAAHWVMAPRSIRRFWPAFGWFGPLAMGLPAHAFASQVRAILDAPEELADALGALAVPTLVVVGNQDILTPRGDSEELAERIPGAELVVISGAAHGLMIEHATTFNRVVLEFLSRVAADQTAA